MTTTAISPPQASDSPPDSAGSGPAPKAKKARKAATPPSQSVAVERRPLDPIVKPLWRLKRTDRLRLLDPFIGEQIRVDRWYGRVASAGDQQYTGTLLAVAWTTTGSTADFLILKETGGTVYAISTAQVYFLEKVEPPRKRTAAATAARRANAAARVKQVADVPETA